jgi:hypothetical protein
MGISVEWAVKIVSGIWMMEELFIFRPNMGLYLIKKIILKVFIKQIFYHKFSRKLINKNNNFQLNYKYINI